jgi:hypothetical protein
VIAPGPFKLHGGNVEAELTADLVFRWQPESGVRFEGGMNVGLLNMKLSSQESWRLEGTSATGSFFADILFTNQNPGATASHVRGITQSFEMGQGPFEELRFCLANFPSYLGEFVTHFSPDGTRYLNAARMRVASALGSCQIDAIHEAKPLLEQAKLEGGFVVSHVGKWIPHEGSLNPKRAVDILSMLQMWFGFLRGAWAGPLFPEGIADGNRVVWKQFPGLRIEESLVARTWMPDRRRLDLNPLFAGFVQHWCDRRWRKPMITAVSLLVEANGRKLASEAKVTLAQVALELLAWVHLVETSRMHSRRDFKGLSAAGRIRTLLHHARISTAIPDYMPDLKLLEGSEAFDGPGVLTEIRNEIVHAGERKVGQRKVTPMQFWQCSELAIQYVELALLALWGHRGHFARRGFRGWKGDDEVLVPWVMATS